MPTVIGFTGAFGSGCTTAAKHLQHEHGFIYIALSQPLRAQWATDHPGSTPSRHDLQRLGDAIREAHGAGELVRRSLATLQASLPDRIVVDGIRNLAEIDELESRFGYDFTLIAVLANAKARWDRIGTEKYRDVGLTEADFGQDDARDRNEEVSTGQQVELCTDRADVFINNNQAVDIGTFKVKVRDAVNLITRQQLRQPSQTEIYMNMAYAASHSSKCLKRHVGAVIVSAGYVVGVGYNENPVGTLPCVDEPKYDNRCYRDLLRTEHLERLKASGLLCPKCGKALDFGAGPPWRCLACDAVGVKTNLEDHFFPDRAMTWCTAVHAEIWALLAAGQRAKDAQLYTTTFPCFQCVEKIKQGGIASVCYTEAYPDPYSEHRLELSNIKVEQFEGVRSSGFHRFFDPTRPH